MNHLYALKKLRIYQLKNFENPLYIINNLTEYLDSVKSNMLSKNIFVNKTVESKYYISNFNEKNNQRLFNISIATKLTNGLIRNNRCY